MQVLKLRYLTNEASICLRAVGHNAGNKQETTLPDNSVVMQVKVFVVVNSLTKFDACFHAPSESTGKFYLNLTRHKT